MIRGFLESKSKEKLEPKPEPASAHYKTTNPLFLKYKEHLKLSERSTDTMRTQELLDSKGNIGTDRMENLREQMVYQPGNMEKNKFI